MRFRADIEGAAAVHGLDPDVVEGIVMQESAGRWWAYRYEPAFFTRYLAGHPLYRDRDPREVSASYGLMQVMFTTAIENGFKGEPWALFDPAVSLDLGCHHLAHLIARLRGKWTGPILSGESIVLRSALASYNGGLTGNDPDMVPDRNHAYAEAVLARAAAIKKRGQG
jgi:soluble lytic murein transglycosylase-like protein